MCTFLDVNWELDRKSITLRKQLGIGEFGPIYDAELQLGLNMTSRAVVKVKIMTVYKYRLPFRIKRQYGILTIHPLQVFQQGTSQDLVRFREEVEEIK